MNAKHIIDDALEMALRSFYYAFERKRISAGQYAKVLDLTSRIVAKETSDASVTLRKLQMVVTKVNQMSMDNVLSQPW